MEDEYIARVSGIDMGQAYMAHTFVGTSIAMRPTTLKKPMRTTVATILPGRLWPLFLEGAGFCFGFSVIPSV